MKNGDSFRVKRARGELGGVPTGQVRETVFSASDTGELIGLQGGSFIIRYPKLGKAEPTFELGWQWYVDGNECSDRVYFIQCPLWSGAGQHCYDWLVDIALLLPWFDAWPPEGCALFARATCLSSSIEATGRARLAFPRTWQGDSIEHMLFVGSSCTFPEGSSACCLASWFMPYDGWNNKTPMITVCEKSGLACMFWLRCD